MIEENPKEITKKLDKNVLDAIKAKSLTEIIIETIRNRTGDVSQYEITGVIKVNYKRVDGLRICSRTIRNNLIGLSIRGILIRMDQYEPNKFDDKQRLFRLIGDYEKDKASNNNIYLVSMDTDLSILSSILAEADKAKTEADKAKVLPFDLPVLSVWKAPRIIIPSKPNPLHQVGGAV